MDTSNLDSDAEISIVMPVYNDPEGVRATVESIRPQLARNASTLVIVDNNSTDRTPAVIESYTNDELISSALEDTVQSSYAARNTGIRQSAGGILSFIDADMTVPDDWLATARRTLEKTNAAYIGCNVESTLPNDPTLSARYDHHTGFPVRQYLEHQHFAPTCCLFVRREVFEDVGLFDHRLESGGDKEFGNRVHDAGYDLHFADDATMYHPTRNSLRAHVKKDRRVGRGLCQLQRYHPDRYGTPGIPPRPSGIKRPDRDLPAKDRLAFGALSRLLTAVRGLGYYEEYLTGNRRGNLESVPQLET